jgi:hypothetical protein
MGIDDFLKGFEHHKENVTPKFILLSNFSLCWLFTSHGKDKSLHQMYIHFNAKTYK